jgi:hypothetical protein
MIRRIFVALASLVVTAGPAWALQPPNPGQDGFLPLDQLPPSEQLPAAPLLIGAYVFFLALMMFYLWTIWRRLGKVEREMQELARRQEGRAR